MIVEPGKIVPRALFHFGTNTYRFKVFEFRFEILVQIAGIIRDFDLKCTRTISNSTTAVTTEPSINLSITSHNIVNPYKNDIISFVQRISEYPPKASMTVLRTFREIHIFIDALQ